MPIEDDVRPVLIVEDDPMMREALESMLDFGGYAATSVGSANEALSYLASGRRPRLILLDLVLPDVQGEAFYATIRADETLATVPVIIFTGQSDPPTLPGVFRTFMKVESPEALLGTVHAACRAEVSGPSN